MDREPKNKKLSYRRLKAHAKATLGSIVHLCRPRQKVRGVKPMTAQEILIHSDFLDIKRDLNKLETLINSSLNTKKVPS
jgi:hypothetical protein